MLVVDVGVRHDLDRGREELVAADVVAVGVGVDDVGDRLVGDGLHLVHDRLAPVGQLGVDEHHAVGGDEDGGVAAAAGHHVEVVLDLLDRGRRRLGPAGGRLLRDERASRDGHHAPRRRSTTTPACASCDALGEEDALDEPVRAGQRNDDRAYHRHTAGGRRALTPEGAPARRPSGTTRASWPSSTPRLNPNSDQPSAACGRPNSRSTAANPKPCTSPKTPAIGRPAGRGGGRSLAADQQVVDADEHDAERDRRLDDRRRRGDDAEGGERQRDAVADR